MTTPSSGLVFVRLSAMMFLQFFVWGAWYVTCGPYMSAKGMDAYIGWAYSVGPIAALISPFFLGLVADRFFPSERVLGAMHVIGGVAMFATPWAASVSPTLFIALLLIHMLAYMPTLGLTNTLAFHNLTNQERQFPIIRVFGTIGWIVGNLITSFVFKADTEIAQFYIAGVAALALGLFSFIGLPHTPPPAKGTEFSARAALGLDALAALSSFSFWVFLFSSMLVCIPLAAYYAFAGKFVGDLGIERIAGTMSLGQVSEIVFMVTMPLFFARLGVKWMLAVGMLAWVARYGLFAAAGHAMTSADELTAGITGLALLGILLHGICYDFFFVTGFIYTDKKSSPAIRGQAQGLLVLATQGVGLLVGAQLCGWLNNRFVGEKTGTALFEGYTTFWLVPCIMAAVVLVAFALFFRDDAKRTRDAA